MLLYIQVKSNLFTLLGLRWNPVQDLRPFVISFSYERRCCGNQIYNTLYGHTRAYLDVDQEFQHSVYMEMHAYLCKSCCHLIKIVHHFYHRQNTAETDIQYRFVGRSARHPSYGRYLAKEASILGHKKKQSQRAKIGKERRWGEGRAYIHFQQPKVDAAVAILWATATTCSSQVNTAVVIRHAFRHKIHC